MTIHTTYNPAQVSAFAQKWRVRELSLFGSVLRDDFNENSDVDVLVSFESNANTSYWDWPDMTEELSAIFGRKVDLISKEGLRNPFRRHEILRTMEVIHGR